MRKRLLLAVTVSAASLAGTAMGDIFYTVRTGDRMLRSFDTQTLQFTDIGPLGVPFDFGGLSWDPVSQQMYMVQGFAGTNLYTVDLNSGAATLVGNHGSNDLFSLAYDPRSNTMFAGDSTRSTAFYDIDLGNADLNFRGDPGINLDGMTYDPVRQQIVGAFAGPGDLYSIDPTDGGATLLYNGDFFNNGGLAYDFSQDLLWFIDWSGNLYSFDPNNGYQRTLVLSGLGAHDGLAGTVIPAPGAMAVLAVGLAAFPVRRCRRQFVQSQCERCFA